MEDRLSHTIRLLRFPPHALGLINAFASFPAFCERLQGPAGRLRSGIAGRRPHLFGRPYHIFRRLHANNLYAKVDKCEFGVDTTNFLNFIISSDSLKKDDAKV